MEKSTKVVPFWVTLHCDLCGLEMKDTGSHLTSNPPQKLYRCDCGSSELTTKSYPRIDWRKPDAENDSTT